MTKETLISKCAINQILNNPEVYEEYGHIIRKAQTDKNALDYYFTSHILEEVNDWVKINGMEQSTIAHLSDLLNFSKIIYRNLFANYMSFIDFFSYFLIKFVYLLF